MSEINPIGTIWDSEMPTVFIHDGLRGRRGLPGEEGEPGDQGDSINLLGPWTQGAIYGPNDAVTWRSSAVSGVTSLYIQFSNYNEGVSTIEPQDDPARWAEIGVTSSESAFGGLWQVFQVGHPFSRLGQPAALTATGYQLASAASTDLFGIAMVREIIDADNFILQSTGGIPEVDPAIFTGGGAAAADIYYVATTAGYLTDVPPTASNQLVNAIYMSGQDPLEGVVLPWRPDQNTLTTIGLPVAREKFYYTASGGQTDFTGPDSEGNTPDYSTAADEEVFQNGLNLRETDQYTLTSDTMTLTSPANAGDRIEIWVDTAQAAGGNAIKLDPLAPFDDVTVTFDLNVGAASIALVGAEDLRVYLDGNPQEPDVDYTVADNGGQTQITFAFAPETHTNEWIVLEG